MLICTMFIFPVISPVGPSGLEVWGVGLDGLDTETVGSNST
jgi:hypothetical protein